MSLTLMLYNLSRAALMVYHAPVTLFSSVYERAKAAFDAMGRGNSFQ